MDRNLHISSFCVGKKYSTVYCSYFVIWIRSVLDASRVNNDYLIAVFVLSAILILTMIAMIAIILYCIKKKSRSINNNNPESDLEYQNTVITDENHEYNQIQLKKERNTTDNEAAHYMDISTTNATYNNEYINLRVKWFTLYHYTICLLVSLFSGIDNLKAYGSMLVIV